VARSAATTAQQYLAGLPEDRRREIRRVRDVVRAHLPDGYGEMIGYGMITWGVPLSYHPDTYNGQPLPLAALASQKNYMSLHLLGAYADAKQRARLERDYAKRGKRLDMGRACLRFRTADELPLDLIGELIASRTPDQLIELMESIRSRRKKPTGRKAKARKSGKKAAPKTPAAKKAAGRRTPAKAPRSRAP
jgi:hypothetical protein